MKMLALKEVRIIKPPFKEAVFELVGWAKPSTVSVKGSEIAGGLMVAPTALVTSQIVEGAVVKVQYPDDTVVEGVETTVRRGEKDPLANFFLNGYAVDKKDGVAGWLGLPNRSDPVEGDTYLFSYVHDHGHDYVVQFEAIPLHKSKAFAAEKIEVNSWERRHTYPVVDRYGYLVGINVGTCDDEIMCQSLTLKGAKI
jgi:hypothetical protein